MACLFSLNLWVSSKETKVIKGKNEEPDSVYYVVTLSTGAKSFEVTCGEKNPLVGIEPFTRCKVAFDIVDKKLKAVDALPLAPSVANKGGEK